MKSSMGVRFLVLVVVLSGSIGRVNAATTETLHDFFALGTYPSGNVIEGSDGNLYGTTRYGGAFGGGTVFKIAKNGTGFALLHSFDCYNATDGCNPYAGVIEGSDGNLYGTTLYVGAYYYDGSTVFKLAKDGTSVSLLHSFDYCYSDTGSCGPWAGVIEGSDGNLYGTTLYGGAYGVGTVYRTVLNPLALAPLRLPNAETGVSYR